MTKFNNSLQQLLGSPAIRYELEIPTEVIVLFIHGIVQTLRARDTLALIIQLHEHGACTISNKTLSEFLRCSEVAARRTIYELIKQNFVEAWFDGPTNRVLVPNTKHIKDTAKPLFHTLSKK